MANCNPCKIHFTLEEPSYKFNLGCMYVAGGEGTKDYEKLFNKPQINLVTLIGNKTGEELGLQNKIQDITEQDIDRIIYGG